jgi:hypothetical protein
MTHDDLRLIRLNLVCDRKAVVATKTSICCGFCGLMCDVVVEICCHYYAIVPRIELLVYML